MARNKKKKRKQSPKKTVKLSPAAYIRKKARNLPISKCYIHSAWKESGMTNVFVARAHKNGNYTIGIYLVDLQCLGIKDAFYQFNVPDFQLQEMISRGNENTMVECDYNQIHNIIYGAKKYAENLGFEPHKDWELTQYILEPVDENIPFIDIEFGQNGKPHYMAGPNDDTYFINRVMKTLEKNVGTGNFNFSIPRSQFSSELDYFIDEDGDYQYEEE